MKSWNWSLGLRDLFLLLVETFLGEIFVIKYECRAAKLFLSDKIIENLKLLEFWNKISQSKLHQKWKIRLNFAFRYLKIAWLKLGCNCKA